MFWQMFSFHFSNFSHYDGERRNVVKNVRVGLARPISILRKYTMKSKCSTSYTRERAIFHVRVAKIHFKFAPKFRSTLLGTVFKGDLTCK